MKYRLLAGRIYNRPLLIEPLYFDALVSRSAHLFGLRPTPDSIDRRPEPELICTQGSKWSEDRQFRITAGGVALVDVTGVLRHKGGFDPHSTYFQGYQEIARSYESALAHDDVRAIVLYVDSPGGEVTGLFECAARLRAGSEIKRTVAVVDDMAASAAYLLASATSEISITDTAQLGSIGVVFRHTDISQRLEQEGITETLLYAGDQKVWGASSQPLSEEARAFFQADVDDLYRRFVASVAEYRGLEADAIRATEAGLFRGHRALEAGLADRLETPDELLRRLATDPLATAPLVTDPEKPMSTDQTPEPEAPGATRPQGQLDALTTRLAAQQQAAEAQLAKTQLATARLDIGQRLDALGSRINLGMRQAGLAEALVQLSLQDVQVSLGPNAEPTSAVDILFAVLEAIPQMTALEQGETAGDAADRGAPTVGVRSTQDRQYHLEHGVDDARFDQLQAKYGFH